MSLDATPRNLNRLRSWLAGLDLDAASTLHAVVMSIDVQMTTEQVRGPAIQVHALEKSYDDLHVLRGVDFDVARGSIFALLGSNGAGKTTVVKILSTLLKPDAGTATVDWLRRRHATGERAGVHQPHRAVRGRRRDPHRAGEPGAGGPAAAPEGRRPDRG